VVCIEKFDLFLVLEYLMNYYMKQFVCFEYVVEVGYFIYKYVFYILYTVCRYLYFTGSCMCGDTSSIVNHPVSNLYSSSKVFYSLYSNR